MSLKLKVWEGQENIQGFTLKPGFVALVEGDDILAVTSGWEHWDACGPMLFVYRPLVDGTWAGRWEDETTFPVQEVLEGIALWRDSQDLKKALQYAEVGAICRIGVFFIIAAEVIKRDSLKSNTK
jgi:hypothetical protein